MRRLIILLITLLLLPVVGIKAESNLEEVHFFFKDNCQHCEKEEKWLDKFQDNDSIVVHKYNIRSILSSLLVM